MIEKRYGCEDNRQKERFRCDKPCLYLMSDKKCGRLTDYEVIEEE